MISHPLTFVTALYYSSYNDIIGGRGYTINYYYPNLKALTCLGVPLVVYTHKQEEANLISAFKNFNFETYTIIVLEFEEFLHHEYLISTKLKYTEVLQKNGLINDRCHHIYWQKPIWLYQQAQINLYQSQYFLWIDIGLFHHGIFPDTMGGTERYKQYEEIFYYPENKNSLFNPQLANAILNYLQKHEHFLITNIKNNKNFSTNDINLLYKQLKQHIIAGIFGGNLLFLEFLNHSFIQTLDLITQKNKLFTEEDILTSIFKQNMNSLNAIPFSHFHHSVKHEINLCYIDEAPNQISFWQIFENLINGVY